MVPAIFANPPYLVQTRVDCNLEQGFMESTLLRTHPSFLCCPLTGRVFTDPVICVDGITFERSAIQEHFRQQRMQGVIFMTNPITHSVMMDTQLIPNLAIKQVIERGHTTTFYNNSIVMQVPTLAMSVIYKAQQKLNVEYQVDIEIENDDAPQHFGTRQVTLRPLDPKTTALPVQVEFRIWDLVQKQCCCFAKGMRFDEDSGLPFTQLLFAIPSSSRKIGWLLQMHHKLAFQKMFGINLLVEKRKYAGEQDERTVILTAWNSSHDNVPQALATARDFILDKVG